MNIKVVALILQIYPDDATHFKANIRFVGMDSPFQDGNFITGSIDVGSSSFQLEEFIKDAVKAHMIGTYGYSFGSCDVVRLLGANI